MRASGLLAVAALFTASNALAHGAGGAQLPTDAPAVTPDGEKAKQALGAAEKSEVAKRPVTEGKRALARAHGAKLGGDVEGARLLSRLALAWSGAATAADRAAKSEGDASKEEARAKDVSDKLARANLTLAETESRRGQLEAEIARVEADAKKATSTQLDTEKKRIDGTKSDAKAPKKPKPAGDDKKAPAKNGGKP